MCQGVPAAVSSHHAVLAGIVRPRPSRLPCGQPAPCAPCVGENKSPSNPPDGPFLEREKRPLLFYVLLQNAFPMLSSQQLVQRLYPYNSILGKDGRAAVEGVLSVSPDVLSPFITRATRHSEALTVASVRSVLLSRRDLSFWTVAVSQLPAPLRASPGRRTVRAAQMSRCASPTRTSPFRYQCVTRL